MTYEKSCGAVVFTRSNGKIRFLLISNLELPILPNKFFIKKAEIELNKILNRK